MKQWYTLHTKPNAESQVEATLRQREIESYLPEFVSLRAGKQRKTEPFFPCYLFMRVDLAIVAASQWQWIPGLRRILSFDGAPAAVPDSVINLIRRKVDELNANGRFAKRPFEPGDRVRIVEGPLRDMVAIFDGPTTAGQRVQVLLDFLGRANRVWVDVNQLEKFSHKDPHAKRPRRTRGHGRFVR